MKRLALLSLLFLSACAQAPTLPVSRLSAQNTATAPEPRLFEKFSGYLLRSSYDSLKLAEMGLTVKSLLGKTYDNRHSASRNHLYYVGQENGLAAGNGPVRLGKDGGLYLEDLTLQQGQTQRVYYRLGSYSGVTPQGPEGQAIAFQLDPGVSLKMKWRGLNPMDHDEIHWRIPAAVQPQPKNPGELLGF
ncbi:MAG: hypothetical protein ACO1RX_11820 [Candidatus Sericytochromatia bacterium]